MEKKEVEMYERRYVISYRNSTYRLSIKAANKEHLQLALARLSP
jgi:hypothetical protein